MCWVMGVAHGRIDVVFESERLIFVFIFCLLFSTCASDIAADAFGSTRGSCATPWPGDEFPAQLRAELALGCLRPVLWCSGPGERRRHAAIPRDPTTPENRVPRVKVGPRSSLRT